MATGEAVGDEAANLLDHAVGCDACGELLSNSLQALEGKPSPEEAAAIAEMASQVEWQSKLAQKLAATSTRRPAVTPLALTYLGRSLGQSLGRSPILRWLAVGAAAAGLGGVALLLWTKQIDRPEHQLGMAYAGSRTMELRIPEAAYGAVTAAHRTRGVAGDHEASSLLDAKARVARELEHSPEDAHWLEVQARTDLLEERYDSAIDVLDRLVAAGFPSAETLTDAATAYYQRGLASDCESDRSMALDYLRRADELAPTDPVVLFNEAIVMEDRGQIINAVEVWNRYKAVERDQKWLDEGKRKLDALEQKLNRLKTHQSRLMQKLSSPQAMEMLSNDAPQLASLDEELTSIELDKLLPIAFPLSNAASGIEQARGSPCSGLCLASRRLLKSLAASLEQHHKDYWLSDLLTVDPDSLPEEIRTDYSRAMNLLAQAMREDQTGLPTNGMQKALQSLRIFHELRSSRQQGASVEIAARVGEDRASVEYLFAMQRSEDFLECREYAQRRHTEKRGQNERYPWIEAVAAITEKVCDDTPKTRDQRNKLQARALSLAEKSRYEWLLSRVHLREADDTQDRGEVEATERIAITTLRDLESKDSPTIRVANTVPQFEFGKTGSAKTRLSELSMRESLAWWQLAGSTLQVNTLHLALARAELRIGATQASEDQLQLARKDNGNTVNDASTRSMMAEDEIYLSDALLERGNLSRASRYLSLASHDMDGYSDLWGLRVYAVDTGLLALDQGDPRKASSMLEQEILSSEARPSSKDASPGAGYAQMDHDLYGELVASWLAQGRSSEQALALWERFRLRSRGLHAAACSSGKLDCDVAQLRTSQKALGNNILIGQIVLLDRVLIYRMDSRKIQWTQTMLRRQDLLDGALALWHAVSSPRSTLGFTQQAGIKLGGILLPALPASVEKDSTLLLLEPDPALSSLPWPVLPTPAGPLGLTHSLIEVRSLLIPQSRPADDAAAGESELIIGASMAAGEEQALPKALVEARAVSRTVNAPELLLGSQATSSQIAKDMGTARLFHFAGHAIQGVNGTELLLASSMRSQTKSDNQTTNDRPWIDAAFLRKHPPRRCRLAVLSACGTGAQDGSSDLATQDLVETLSSLGVPQVVATRWQVDSEASVSLIEAFYQNLAKGSSVPAALTAARKTLSADPLYNNPYYWAAYYATGEGQTNLNGVLHASR